MQFVACSLAFVGKVNIKMHDLSSIAWTLFISMQLCVIPCFCVCFHRCIKHFEKEIFANVSKQNEVHPTNDMHNYLWAWPEKSFKISQTAIQLKTSLYKLNIPNLNWWKAKRIISFALKSRNCLDCTFLQSQFCFASTPWSNSLAIYTFQNNCARDHFQ